MLNRYRSWQLTAVAVFLSACGHGPTPPMDSNASTQQSVIARYSRTADAKAFSLGLQTEVDAVGDTAVLPVYYKWCDGVKGEPKYGCPAKPGKRSYDFGPLTEKRSLEADDGAPAGYTTGTGSVQAALGASTYNLSATTHITTEINLHQNGVYSSADLDEDPGTEGWTDTLYVASATLPAGTPVNIGAKITVKPSTTNIACDSAGDSTGRLDFYAPFALDSSGNGIDITGICHNGTFEYFTEVGYTPGTSTEGTIATAVGDSVGMNFATDGTIFAGCSGNCFGEFTAKLAGSYTFTITSITSGATYTTASGKTYK